MKRQDHEPPAVTIINGWKYHHLGIPTTLRHSDEKYIERYKMFVSGFDSSPYGIEWMRFEPDSPISELVRLVPHIAFEVDDLDSALDGKEVLTEPMALSKDIRVALIVHDGAPIELLEFRNKRRSS